MAFLKQMGSQFMKLRDMKVGLFQSDNQVINEKSCSYRIRNCFMYWK